MPRLRFSTSNQNTLNGVELRGDLNLNNGSSNTARIVNGLVLRNETRDGKAIIARIGKQLLAAGRPGEVRRIVLQIRVERE